MHGALHHLERAARDLIDGVYSSNSTATYWLLSVSQNARFPARLLPRPTS